MMPNQLAIKTDLSLIVHSLEDQLDPPTSPGFRNLELPPVDHPLILPDGSHHPGEGGLHTERNPDLLSQHLRYGVTPSLIFVKSARGQIRHQSQTHSSIRSNSQIPLRLAQSSLTS